MVWACAGVSWLASSARREAGREGEAQMPSDVPSLSVSPSPPLEGDPAPPLPTPPTAPDKSPPGPRPVVGAVNESGFTTTRLPPGEVGTR